MGHLFQGRFKAVLVQKEAHLLELARHVVLNPVRARMVKAPENWPWSSYGCMFDERSAPAWLDTHWLLARSGVRRSAARKAYQEGDNLPSPLLAARHQLFLGDDDFIATHLPQGADNKLSEISQTHRRALPRARHDSQPGSKSRRGRFVGNDVGKLGLTPSVCIDMIGRRNVLFFNTIQYVKANLFCPYD